MQDKFDYSDVEPVPIEISDNHVAQIMYTEEFKRVFGVLGALMGKEEYSERALALTEDALALNAANYTAWEYRYNNIIKLGKDLVEELDWVENVAVENIKNYQIWNYRQLLIRQIGFDRYEIKREFPLINTMIEDDSKNYHVWSHRKWVVSHLDEYQYEMEFVDSLISKDVYNNSAWSHRYFVVAHAFCLCKRDSPEAAQLFTAEKEYTLGKIEASPQNLSSWNYLRGVYELFGRDLGELNGFILKFADLEASEGVVSVPALEMLCRNYSTTDPQLAIRGYDLLASKYDPVRANYWSYLKSCVN